MFEEFKSSLPLRNKWKASETYKGGFNAKKPIPKEFNNVDERSDARESKSLKSLSIRKPKTYKCRICGIEFPRS